MSWIFLVVTLASIAANAGDSATPVVPTAIGTDVIAPQKKSFALEQRRYWGMMGAAIDMRIERDQEQNTSLSKAPAFSVGLGYKHLLGVLDYSTFEDSREGNKTLNSRRSTETAMLWGQYFTDDEWMFRPFFAIGAGAHREHVTANFYSEQVQATGRWTEMFGGAFGFRWASFSPLWLTIEGRVLFAKDFDPNPALGCLVKVGFVLE